MIDQVRQTVVAALAQMNYDLDEVTGETRLGPAGLDLESLAVAELALRVEEVYGVKFAEDEMERFADMTVDDFASYIAQRADPAMSGPAE